MHAIHNTDVTIAPKDVFGFWIYILTDCILFATLFATYIVYNSPFNDYVLGPKLAQHIDLNYALIETFALLTSNFTFGLAALAFNDGNTFKAISRLFLTMLFGILVRLPQLV